MPVSLQETPSGNRLHIGVFGRTNSGKSSLINALTGQQVSIVSAISGTTTDPVYKAMELYPLGPCVLIDTAGFDDDSALGASRMEKTKLAAEKTELALLLFSDASTEEELSWFSYFKEKGIPTVVVISQWDVRPNAATLRDKIQKKIGQTAIAVSARTGFGLSELKEALARALPADRGERLILGGLVSDTDLVLLVMPQDIQAPKGRLILPQVQTLRELLDRKCLVMCVTTDRLLPALHALHTPPKLIVTDSQAFSQVSEHKPKESLLTSFSVLFAAYKGDLPYYMEGARRLDALSPTSRVLIAECCTHAPLQEDIGRVKLPRLLRKRYGDTLSVDVTSGTDFPADLTAYDLIIQCGACMFNRQYVLARIDRARSQQIPMTNYGVALAHLTGILEQVAIP